MLMLPDAMSIFARSTCAPSSNSPARMRRNRSRFSSTERLRYGLSRPGSVSVPRYSRIWSAVRLSTYALPSPHELLGPLIELLEIVGRVVQVLAPVEAEPPDVALDLVDVLLRFLDGVRVVEAQIAPAAELLRDAEIDADRLGVADVQAAVRLRGESRDDRARRVCRTPRPARRSPG